MLVPVLLGWQDQGLTFDVAVHVGSLFAVVGYFRLELWHMAVDWLRSITGGAATEQSRLAWLVVLGTIPAVLAGLVLNRYVDAFRSPLVIAATTIGFGMLLWWADRHGAKRRSETTLLWRDALLIGIAQAAALVPGTSAFGCHHDRGFMAWAHARGGRALFVSACCAANRRRRFAKGIGGGVRPGAYRLVLAVFWPPRWPRLAPTPASTCFSSSWNAWGCCLLSSTACCWVA